jgi:hypothetical protein
MRTVRTKVFFFNELSKEAQENAIEKERDSVYNNLFLDFFNDSATEQISEKGFFDSINIQYSLSYSQGDGFSFSCNKVEKDVLIKIFTNILGPGKEKTIDILIDNSNFDISLNSRYCYAAKNQLTYELENTRSYDWLCCKVVEEVQQELREIYIDLCNDLENQGYKEIEYQLSDEAIIENLIANEYEFTEEGNIF